MLCSNLRAVQKKLQNDYLVTKHAMIYHRNTQSDLHQTLQMNKKVFWCLLIIKGPVDWTTIPAGHLHVYYFKALTCKSGEWGM